MILVEVHFTDANNGWAVGDAGTILEYKAGPSLSLNPVTLDFDTIHVGTSDSLTITIHNTGGSPLNVTNISSTAEFGLTVSSLPSIASGDSTEVIVVFTPITSGVKTDTLYLTSNDLSNLVTPLAVTGTAIKQISIALPELFYGGPGDSTTAPLSLTGLLSADTIFTFNMSILYHDSIIHFAGIDSAGFLAENFILSSAVNFGAITGVDPDTLFISGTSSAITSNGVLMYLKFTVDAASVPGDSTFLQFAGFSADTAGALTMITQDGLFRNARLQILGDANGNGLVNAADASLVLQTTVHSYSPTSLEKMRMEVSGNGSVRAYDASLILQRSVNIITSFPAGSSFVAKEGNDETGTVEIVSDFDENGIITLDLQISGFESIYSADMTFSYGQYEYLGYELAEVSREFHVEVNETEDGKLHVAMASAHAAESGGEFIRFRYRRLEDESSMADMTLKELIVNENNVLGDASITVDVELPLVYELGQNYPNPFNPVTTITYQLPEASQVTLKIYNILGQEIKTLVHGEKSAGFYTLQWDGTNSLGVRVSSGLYIYRISTNSGFVRSRKMLYLK